MIKRHLARPEALQLNLALHLLKLIAQLGFKGVGPDNDFDFAFQPV